LQHTRLVFNRVGMSLVGAVLLFCLVFTSPVWAHASLISTKPADGTLLQAMPRHVVLRFSEPVSPLVLAIIEPDGTRLPIDQIEAKGAELLAAVPQGLGTGTHVLTWRVVSEDGHPISGSLVFSLGRHTAPPSTTASLDNPSVMALLWVGRIALYVGLFLGIGGVFARHWLFREGHHGQWPLTIFLLVGVLSLPVLLAAQGLDALGLPFSAVAQPGVWATGAKTSLGPALLVAASALGLAALSLSSGQTAGRILTLLALIGAGVALACTGHASSAPPHLLTRPLVALHGMAVAFWLGALLPILAAFKHIHPDAVPALLRFSRSVPAVLMVLIIAGATLAVIQLGSIASLWTTPYGRLLVAKLGLVMVLLLLGAWNRWRLTGPVAQGSNPARVRLVRSIGVELIVGLLIFGIVAGWRFTPPPRSIVSGEPVSLHLHSDKVMAHVILSSDRVGPVTISLALIKPTGAVLEAKEVSIELTLPAAGIEPVRRQAVRNDTGQWAINNVVIPLSGTWTVTANVLVSNFEAVKLSGELRFK
jgi:copper transport protein